jgi:uncharacterized protein (TIGR03067 family)
MRRSMLLLIAAGVSVAVAVGDDDRRNELKELAGRWKVVGVEADGKPLTKESVPDFVFVVGAGGKAKGIMGKGEYESTITVDAARDPKTIDNAHETGAHKGKKQFGVYKLKGDKWTVCMTAPGAKESDRPKSFDTKNTRNALFIFERVKVNEKE